MDIGTEIGQGLDMVCWGGLPVVLDIKFYGSFLVRTFD